MNVKALVKSLPGARSLYKRYRQYIHASEIKKELDRLKVCSNKSFVGDPKSNVIFSLTSFPPRITNVSVTIQSLFSQTIRPRAIILILAEDQFPGRVLPAELSRLEERGLTILWVKDDIKSYKKLIPVALRNHDSTVITFDDDVIYEPWRAERLLRMNARCPDCVIGHRGRHILLSDGRAKPYRQWIAAGEDSDPKYTLLTGVGGILYPLPRMNLDILCDVDLAMSLAPTSDDIWFWGATIASGLQVKCLGNFRQLTINFRDGPESLSRANVFGEGNDQAFRAVADHFGVFK